MRFRSSRATQLLLASSLVLVAGSATAAASASPTSPSVSFFVTSDLAVTSSTGHDLDLSMFTYPADSPELEIQLSDAAGEDHEWELPIKKHTFGYDIPSGQGSIETGDKLIAPLGEVDVDISAVGDPVVRHCGGGGTETKQPVSVTGTVFFDTQSTTWGAVGSMTDPTTFSDKSFIDLGNTKQCGLRDGVAACAGEVDWIGGGHGGDFDDSTVRFHGNVETYLDYETEQSISKPVGALRDDMDLVPFTPATLIKGRHGKRTVKVDAGTGGLFTGTAKIISMGKPEVSSTLCSGEKSKSWKAKYVPGKDPLTVHQELGGDFTATAGPAYLSRDGKK